MNNKHNNKPQPDRNQNVTLSFISYFIFNMYFYVQFKMLSCSYYVSISPTISTHSVYVYKRLEGDISMRPGSEISTLMKLNVNMI